MRIFGFNMKESKGCWVKLHFEAFHHLYFSLNIIRVIKSRRIRRAERVAYGRDKICWQNFNQKHER
jgi:hypothetical protein